MKMINAYGFLDVTMIMWIIIRYQKNVIIITMKKRYIFTLKEIHGVIKGNPLAILRMAINGYIVFHGFTIM